jgi:hypothetical protein
VKLFQRFAAVALIAVTAGCSTTVTGKITDATTQQGVGDTQVWLHTKNARIKYLGASAKDGSYTVEVPAYAFDNPGVIQFQRQGYQTAIVPPKGLPGHPNIAMVAGSDAAGLK